MAPAPYSRVFFSFVELKFFFALNFTSHQVSLGKFCIAESLIWSWFGVCTVQITNLGHAVAHLEYSEFINITTRLKTNSCAYTHVLESFLRSSTVYKNE